MCKRKIKDGSYSFVTLMCQNANLICDGLAFVNSQTLTQLLTHSFSAGQRDKTGGEDLWVRIETLQHRALHRLQENLCSSTWSSSFSSFFSQLAAHKAVSFSTFPHSSLTWSILPFLKYFAWGITILAEELCPVVGPLVLVRMDHVCSGTHGHLHLLQEIMLGYFFLGI